MLEAGAEEVWLVSEAGHIYFNIAIDRIELEL